MLIYTKNCILSLPGACLSYLLDLLLQGEPTSNPTILKTLIKLPKLLVMMPIRCICMLFEDQTLLATSADITKKTILNQTPAASLVCYLFNSRAGFHIPKRRKSNTSLTLEKSVLPNTLFQLTVSVRRRSSCSSLMDVCFILAQFVPPTGTQTEVYKK